MLMRILVLFGLLWTSSVLFAQDSHPYVKHLQATVTGDQLLVSWTTKAGFSCQDIAVELSTDSVNFVTKAIYFGICGDFEEKDYTLLVDSPFYNRINYIRLDLGTFGYSYVIKKEVIKVETAQAIPHPLTEVSRLYFANPLRAEARVEIVSIEGELLYEIQTEANQVNLQTMQGEQMVFYRIYLDGTLRYRGKLLLSN